MPIAVLYPPGINNQRQTRNQRRRETARFRMRGIGWEARQKQAQEGKQNAWVTALRADRDKELTDDALQFSREEMRVLIMQR